MSARGRCLSGLVTLVLVFAGFVTVGALPAAANSSSVQYVALGDSYAAGQGGGSYLNSCLQTANGYPELLDSKNRIHLRTNEACSGATTSDVAKKQLTALNRATELVTLTVGGNDLDVSGVARACTTGTQTDDCREAIDAAFVALEGLDDSLTELYADVADAAPNARIVVTGYPYLFGLPTLGCDPTVDVICAINNATTALNATIQQAVSVTAQDPDVNIVYVDVTVQFAHHGIGSPVPFINATGPDAFHPNAAGYRAYADAIFDALSGDG